MQLTNPSFVKTDDQQHYIVREKCECGYVTTATITPSELFAYRRGAFVQEAFPNLTPAEREALFQSGICKKCWDEMFADEDGDQK